MSKDPRSRRHTRRRYLALTVALLLTPAIASVPVASAAPPSHDDFSNARVITSLPYTNTTNTTDATTAGDDPTCGGLGNAKSVWYKFTPTSNVIVRVNTSGSDYETVIGAFRGPRGAFTSSACTNDPVGGGVTFVSLSVPAGDTLYIMIAARPGGSGGNLTINVAETRIPPPLMLTLKPASPVSFRSNVASVNGVAELSQNSTGMLCVHVRSGQMVGPTLTIGSAYRCFRVTDAASIPWNLDVPSYRPWRAGPAVIATTAYFIAPGLADVEITQRAITLVQA